MNKQDQIKPEWIDVLKHRSIKDKIAVPIDCDMIEPGKLNIVFELVRDGIIVWIDRAMLHRVAVVKQGKIVKIGINADIYQLTLKGIRLCNQHGIKQR